MEKTGVSDALTKVLVALYEEPDRPKNAIEYIKKHLGGAPSISSSPDIDTIKKENDELKEQIRNLENNIGEMRLQMEKQEEEKQIHEQISGLDGGIIDTKSSM